MTEIFLEIETMMEITKGKNSHIGIKAVSNDQRDAMRSQAPNNLESIFTTCVEMDLKPSR